VGVSNPENEDIQHFRQRLIKMTPWPETGVILHVLGPPQVACAVSRSRSRLAVGKVEAKVKVECGGLLCGSSCYSS